MPCCSLFSLEHVHVDGQGSVVRCQFHSSILTEDVLDHTHQTLVRALDHHDQCVEQPVLVDGRGGWWHQTRSTVWQLCLKGRVQLAEVTRGGFGRDKDETLSSCDEDTIVLRHVPIVEEDEQRSEDVDDFSLALL